MLAPYKRSTLNKADLREKLANPVKEKWYNNIVLSIPHASVGRLGDALWNDKIALIKEVRKWTDWFTDVIFIPENKPGVKYITADYSHFVVDVERLEDDPLDTIGQGIVYTHFNGINRTIDKNERHSLMAYYYAYIEELKGMLDEHSLLIDCHSFPSDLSNADICIGYNDDWSRPSDFVIDLVKMAFENHNYHVEINTPYSNALAPKTGFSYNSIMIELNKSIYLNEQELELLESANKVKATLDEIYMLLLNYWEEL